MTDKHKYPKVIETRAWFGGFPCFVKFESTQAEEALYDASINNLIITFSNGARYLYKKVPHDLWVEFLKSPSKGSFISKNIKGKFEYERISGEDISS